MTVLVPFTQFYVDKDTSFEVTIPISLSPGGGGSTGGAAATGGAGGGAATRSPPTSVEDEVVIILSGTAYESSGESLFMS